MKSLFLTVLFGLFFILNATSQKIGAKILVNGEESFELSRSKENFLTIVGTGFDTYTLLGVGVSLVAFEDGYKAISISGVEKVTIGVMGTDKKTKKSAKIANIEFIIVD
jgi:hypothetical protein